MCAQTSSSSAAESPVMWQHCGLLRDGRGMAQAITCLEAWHALIRAAPASRDADREFRRVRSIVTVGLMIARGARCAARRAAAATFARTFRIATT
jgi:aspartate oxidase